MNDKILAGVNLENIVSRLTNCLALMKVVHTNAANGEASAAALGGVCDLLEGLLRDFMADVESAADAT